MKGNKRRDTKPELAVRRALHARGLRYRVDVRPLAEMPRRADIVFTRLRIAVFVDGCYWHGCPQHGTKARTNASYWAEKIKTNCRRDSDTNERLRAAGWLVLRFWEHESPIAAADEVETVVRRRRAGFDGGR